MGKAHSGWRTDSSMPFGSVWCETMYSGISIRIASSGACSVFRKIEVPKEMQKKLKENQHILGDNDALAQ